MTMIRAFPQHFTAPEKLFVTKAPDGGPCLQQSQGWGERPIFGKIRFMNLAGCKRKFAVDKYIERINVMMREVRAAGKTPGVPA